MELIEETQFSKGTTLLHPIFGSCRVKWVYRDRGIVSIIIGDKKTGTTSDAWACIRNGGLFDFASGLEVKTA